jgi:hypothetical protein
MQFVAGAVGALPCCNTIPPKADSRARMRLLSFAYRFLTNFAFLATVYVSLNYIEKYNIRAGLAILVLVYCGMRSASSLRSFYPAHRAA